MSPKLSFAGRDTPEGYLSAVEKCRLWAVSMCRIARGHDWWLDIAPNDDGVTLYCRKCLATVSDVYPDGWELVVGEFEVCPGYVLSLKWGCVLVNGTEREGYMYGWRGPVTVNLHVEKCTSMDWIGEEYDVWVEVDPRADVAA